MDALVWKLLVVLLCSGVECCCFFSDVVVLQLLYLWNTRPLGNLAVPPCLVVFRRAMYVAQ